VIIADTIETPLQSGMVACPGHFPYWVSKGGIVQMTRQGMPTI
jgi:hypothetical protein